jgi:hypothetical protein
MICEIIEKQFAERGVPSTPGQNLYARYSFSALRKARPAFGCLSKRNGAMHKQWFGRVTELRLAFSLVLLFALVHLSRGAEPFFFIQFSDPQFGMFTNNKDCSQETANFEFAVANANRLKPAFVVITGDLVNKPGDAKQIAEFKRIV